MYKKICKFCGEDYESESRNQRYCCQDCCDKAQIVLNKKKKTRRRKRKEYSENKEINRALSQSYAVCEKVFELFQIPKVCGCERFGFEDECSGELERHHLDSNPFNNSPDNLIYLCKHHHGRFHMELVDNVNIVDTYNLCIDEAGFEDDDVKFEKMIGVFVGVIASNRIIVNSLKSDTSVIDV